MTPRGLFQPLPFCDSVSTMKKADYFDTLTPLLLLMCRAHVLGEW